MSGTALPARRYRRAHVRVTALALAAAVSLALPPTSAGAAPSATAAVTENGVRVLSSSSFIDDESGGTVVTGELQNVSTQTLELPRVMIDQIGLGGHVIASTPAPALADRLDPGEKSGFKGYLSPMWDMTSWRIRTAIGDPAVSPANHRFTITPTGTYTDAYGFAHFTGTVRNDNGGTATRVTVGATFFDTAGTAVDADYTVPLTQTWSRMAGGEVAQFDLVRFEGPAHASVVFMGDAGNDPSPLPVSVAITGTGINKDGHRAVTAQVTKRGTRTPTNLPWLELEYRPLGETTWRGAGHFGSPDENGMVTLSWLEPGVTTDFRMRVDARDYLVSAVSDAVRVVPGTQVWISTNRPVVLPGMRATVHVSSTAEQSRPVTLERWDGKRWQPVERKRLNADHVARFKVLQNKPGRHKYRAVVAAGALSGTGLSVPVIIKIRPN